MTYSRWYDKNELTNRIMHAFENADENIREELANEIIQIILNRQNNLDNFIQIINGKISSNRGRWYDKNESLLTSVKMIKKISQNKDSETLKEVLSTIISYNQEEIRNHG